MGIRIIDRLRTLLGLVQCRFIQVFMCQADLVITVFLYIGTGTVYSTALTTGDRTDLVFFIERAVEIDLSTQSIGIFIASGLVDIPPFRYQMFNTSISIHDGWIVDLITERIGLGGIIILYQRIVFFQLIPQIHIQPFDNLYIQGHIHIGIVALAEITFPVHFFQWIKRLVVEPQADQAVYLRLGFCLIPVQWITVFIE